MAKKKQEEAKKLRYTISCKKCNAKWEGDVLNTCKCGSNYLFADDHRKLTSRKYLNGVMVDAK